jgi:hypothetical protein
VVRLSSTLLAWIPVLVVSVASQYPGITLDGATYWDSAEDIMVNLSLESGFAAAFNISARHARIFTFFPMLICAYCFMWASALQIHALADAHLLFPQLLKQRKGESESPTRALIATIVFGFLCLFMVFVARVMGVGVGSIEKSFASIQAIIILLVYIAVLVAFVYFRTWGHGSPGEKYKSPLGRAGAVCAALIFLCVLAAMPFTRNASLSGQMTSRQETACDVGAFSFVAVYLVGMSVYYFCVAKAAQTTTQAESRAYLSIYAVRGTTNHCCCCYYHYLPPSRLPCSEKLG